MFRRLLYVYVSSDEVLYADHEFTSVKYETHKKFKKFVGLDFRFIIC